VRYSPASAALSTSFLLNQAPNSPKLNAYITRFRESYSSVRMIDPVVDRVERTDPLGCFVDRLHRLVDDFTARLNLDDFRSTWSTCGHVDNNFLLILAYCMATDAKNSVSKHHAFPVPSGRPTGLALLFSFHPLIFS